MWRLQRVFAVFGELGQMIGDDHSLGGQSSGFDKLVGGFERKRYWGGGGLQVGDEGRVV